MAKMAKKGPKIPKILKIAKNGPKMPKIGDFDLRLVPNGHGRQLWPIVTKKNFQPLFFGRKKRFFGQFWAACVAHSEMAKNGQKSPKMTSKSKIFELSQMVQNG